MGISKIVITGGPCAGKSTAMSWIKEEFAQLGYTVLFVPETATELITGGVAPWTCSTRVEYQKCQLKLQLEKEKVFEQAALTMETAKVLIVCDRGALDTKAYLNEREFAEVVSLFGTSEVELRDSYDAVFHLVTAAKGAEDAYTVENNSARTETSEEAAAIDDKLIAAWTGHPHLRIIDNSSPAFEDKMKKLIYEIASFLGEPEPYEIERKFLIKYPDIDWLESNPSCQRIEIVQTYLHSDDGDEIRLRKRGIDGNYIYFQTVKRKITDVKRIETERRLSQAEYQELLLFADPTKKPLHKTRYCLTYENQYFEIDIYPFWDDEAIVEIELSDENTNIVFPKQIEVIKEVTDDQAYKNSSLANM